VQCYAQSHRWSYVTLGHFRHSLHFLVSLPSDVELIEFLTNTLKGLLTKVRPRITIEEGCRRHLNVGGCGDVQAGFPSWSFPEGCCDPDINFSIERYLHFDRK
jgi:hypothetical protein